MQRGFTFLEILVVMGIFALVGGTALFVSMDTYRNINFRSDRNTFIAALQRARAEAVNNVCAGAACTDGKPHGVKLLPDGAVAIFQGGSYATRDEEVDTVFNTNIVTTTGTDEFVFSQLSGTTSCGSGCAVKLTDSSGHASWATTTAEGRIYWSN